MSFLKKHVVATGVVVLAGIAILFFFFIPLSHRRGVTEFCSQPGEYTKVGCATTCEGYDTPDGLSPKTDRYEKYHLLFGQLKEYDHAANNYSSAIDACSGGAQVIDVQLYL